MNVEWRESNNDTFYYFNKDDGRVLGMVFKYMSQNLIWCSKIYKQDLPFNNDNEFHLGQYIGSEFAKRSVEEYWEIQSRTLLS